MDDTTKRPPGEPSLAETLGSRAGRLVKKARPGVEKAAPKLQEAARAAVEYAREHEDELRQVAVRLAKSRVPGILQPAVQAMAASAAPKRDALTPSALACACGHENPPGARFCNQCAARLRA